MRGCRWVAKCPPFRRVEKLMVNRIYPTNHLAKMKHAVGERGWSVAKTELADDRTPTALA